MQWGDALLAGAQVAGADCEARPAGVARHHVVLLLAGDEEDPRANPHELPFLAVLGRPVAVEGRALGEDRDVGVDRAQDAHGHLRPARLVRGAHRVAEAAGRARGEVVPLAVPDIEDLCPELHERVVGAAVVAVLQDGHWRGQAGREGPGWRGVSRDEESADGGQGAGTGGDVDVGPLRVALGGAPVRLQHLDHGTRDDAEAEQGEGARVFGDGAAQCPNKWVKCHGGKDKSLNNRVDHTAPCSGPTQPPSPLSLAEAIILTSEGGGGGSG